MTDPAAHSFIPHDENAAAATAARGCHESDPLYRSLFENAPVGLFVVATDGRIIDANAALVKILGYASREALLSTHVADFHIDREDAARVLARLRQTGEIFDIEVQLGRPDGSTVWLLISARAAHARSGADGENRVLYFHGAIENITARKRAEEAVRDSERRFETFMDNAPVLVFIKDEAERYRYANRRFLELFQRTFEEVYGRPDFEFMPPDSVLEVAAHDRRVLESGEFLETIEHVPGADGIRRSWMVLKFPIADPEERFFVGAFAIDITERQRAEEAMHQNEKRFRDIFESSPDAIFVEDLQGNVVDVNPAACRLHGASREELIGKNAVDLVPPEAREEVLRNFPKIVKGEITRVEATGLSKDGYAMPVAISASRIEYQNVPSLLLHVRDMSEQKRLQEQFLQAQKMEAVGRLAGGIAHDFNNLLTAIIGYNELLLMSLDEADPLRRCAEEVRRAAERATNLTRQLLAFSRKQKLRPRVIDLNAVVLEMEKMIRRLIGDDVELITTPAPEAACAKADPTQIEQVLVNLAVNARDAMPQGGRLSIELHAVAIDEDEKNAHDLAAGEHVLLRVSDTGTGMSEEVRKRLFEPFFTTKEEGKGTGLGLATCYGIVQQSGGKIVCESKPGAGATFFIYLPRVHENSISPAATEQFRETNLPRSRGGETVLIVEDVPSLRALAARVLRSLDYNVLEAENGECALALIAQPPNDATDKSCNDEKRCAAGSQRIDLVVTDMMMPQLNGKDFAALFRPLLPDAKILFISGLPEAEILLREMIDRGDAAFLPKPFSPAILAEKVRQVLDGIFQR